MTSRALFIRRAIGAGPRLAIFASLSLVSASLLAQQPPFPSGVDGELIYCPRIDMLSAKDGGPLTVNLDGLLDDAVWQWAEYQGWTQGINNLWGQAPVDELDCNPHWAAVADDHWIYLAFKIADEARQSQSGSGCGVFNDDAVEIYFDGNNSGGGYGPDDFQLLIPTSNIGNPDPDGLQVGVVRGGGCVSDAVADPNVFRGVVTDLVDPDGTPGWQGEIAIALDSIAHGEWHVNPADGNTIGFDVHVDDDDTGGGQDAGSTSVLIWSKLDVSSGAWNNTSLFGKLQFVSPLTVNRSVPPGLQNGSSGTVSITVTANPGPFSSGVVGIDEEVPVGFVPSNPSSGGVLDAGNSRKIHWNLGTVASEVTVTYTVDIDAQAIDGEFPGRATIDGAPFSIGGDRSYTGSPYNPMGFIKLWSHLGPLAWAYPAKSNDSNTPGACDATDPDTLESQLELDWIVNQDQSVDESNIRPFPGMLVRPAYGGTGIIPNGGARAAGLTTGPDDLGKVVQDLFPVWKPALSRSDSIDHNLPEVFGFNPDDHVTLSCVYVTNHSDHPIDTSIGASSDDSIQVYLGNQPIGQTSICRGYGPGNEEQDLFPVTLPVGESRILVKVSDGGGTSGFRLRFRDPADTSPPGIASSPGLLPPDFTVSLESELNHPAVTAVRSLAKETYTTGEAVTVQLTLSTAGNGIPVHLREALPELSSAGGPSDSGAVSAGAVDWDLTLTGSKTVSYQITPSTCAGQLAFGQSTWKVGVNEALVTGPAVLTREPVGDPDLSPWQSRDIGPAGGGSLALAAREVMVSGTGAGIKQASDEFRFVSANATGDFEISVKIDCIDDPAGTGICGLMVRDTSDPYAAHAFFGLNSVPPAGGGVGSLKGFFRHQTKVGQGTSPISIIKDTIQNQQDVLSLPIWLKLKRAENKIYFQRSANGADYVDVIKDPFYKEIGTAASMVLLQDATQIGLVVTGGGGVTRATFREVSGTPALPPFPEALPPPTRPQNLNATAGDQLVDLAWSDPSGAGPFTGFTIARDGGKIADVDASVHVYHDSGLTNDQQYCYTVAATRGSISSPQTDTVCATPKAPSEHLFRRGDIDGNTKIEVTDAIGILGHLFLGDNTAFLCAEAGDTDNDGTVDVTDAVNNLNFQFLGGTPPAEPGPRTCGSDAGDKFLGCNAACN